MDGRSKPHARTYVTITCEPCGRKLSNRGTPYFVSQAVAVRAFTEHAITKHSLLGSEKVTVKRTVSYEVVR